MEIKIHSSIFRGDAMSQVYRNQELRKPIYRGGTPADFLPTGLLLPLRRFSYKASKLAVK